MGKRKLNKNSRFLSIVTTAYNESKVIEKTIMGWNEWLNKNKIKYEIIVYDDGSIDDTSKVLKKIKRKIKNFKFIIGKTNKGYGYGLKNGLKLAKGEYLGWIHADMQVHPNDLRPIFDFALSNDSKEKIFLKARRTNRPFVDRFFAAGQTVFSSIVFFYKMFDIGASPLIFSKSLIDNYDKMTNDFSIEVFTYLMAKKKNFYIKRFNINLNDRENSDSSWNTGLMSKFKLSLILIKSSLLIKINEITQ